MTPDLPHHPRPTTGLSRSWLRCVRGTSPLFLSNTRRSVTAWQWCLEELDSSVNLLGDGPCSACCQPAHYWAASPCRPAASQPATSSHTASYWPAPLQINSNTASYWPVPWQEQGT
ncbi:uncharacterized protein LOC109894660 isoform X2 [Oncorhynchus kisutch]|uniref:uncharacterized protein LOC109894660 isoform X2 n=1 Tax=Oncorhynchus kisutch TaxID=8019 RepID=UPI0012DF9C7A|nr:uncharacterized protein LOC109894660 isoform X2 [Oncorhynchus kisutch]